MTLINLVSKENLPTRIRTAWQTSMDLRGDARFFEAFANNLPLYNWYIDSFYTRLFNSDRLDKKTKELLRIKLSTLHGCKFCNQGNKQHALDAGITTEQIQHLDNFENGPFDDKEKTILRLSEQIALNNPNGTLQAKLYSELKSFFTDGEILELGMLMGILSGVAKFMFVFDLVEKEYYCPFKPSH